MSEEELDSEINKRCRVRNLWTYHTYDSRRSEKGWLDRVIVGAHVAFRELKTERGRLSSEQLDVIARLEAAGADVGVWRPSDLLSGRIDRELDAVRRESTQDARSCGPQAANAARNPLGGTQAYPRASTAATDAPGTIHHPHSQED